MIRKIITTTILCLAVIAGSQAQDKTFKQEFSIGGSFGMTFSKVSFTSISSKVKTNMKQGYSGGITFRWISEKNLGLLGELNFAQYGWDEQFEDTQYKYARTLNYVELPILTHVYFGSKRFRVFVNLGPKIGYLIGENSDKMLGEESSETAPQHDMAVQKRFDWGLCGGPGFELRTGIGTFQLEGRYYYALGDIFNSRREDYFSKSSNQVMSAKITYLLPLFK